MPNLNIIITPMAELDMLSIFDYIAQDNVKKAFEIIDIFENKIETLKDFPSMGFKKANYIARDVRVYVVAKHYQIVYALKGKTLYILRVLTGYQDLFSK